MIWLKRLAILGGGPCVVLVLAVGGIYGFSAMALRKSYDITISPVLVRPDSATVAHGRHIAVAITKCADCHGPDLGGEVMVDDPALGRIVASDLTRGRGGIADEYTDPDFVRAIRHGVRKDGMPIPAMPSREYYSLNDADLGAPIAYLRSLPPVDRQLPETRLGLVGRGLVLFAGAHLLPATGIDHDGPRPEAVAPGVTVEYGEYLAVTGGCVGCHGPGLSGGPIPGTPPDFPPATNIAPAGIGEWTEADFFRSLRQGIRPDGRVIDPAMPWANVGQMTDDEIRALWMYLRSAPRRETGGR
ncbi:MAG TPA: cytochrome c [Longimicrobiales bacterium]